MNDLRDDLINELEYDLVGPRSEDEVIYDKAGPRSWYVSGILFPKNTKFNQEDEEKLAAGGDEEEDEDKSLQEQVDINRSFKQNSIGLSCRIKENIEIIEASLEYGIYSPLYGEQDNIMWSRKQVRHSIPIDILKSSGEIPLADGGAILKWSIEAGFKSRLMTVFLYNGNELHDDEPQSTEGQESTGKNRKRNKIYIENTRSIFQPKIVLRPTSTVSPFQGIISETSEEGSDDEFGSAERSIDLLFRNKIIFARGFNCAAIWEPKSDPMWISTSILPKYNAKSVKWSSDEPDRPHDIDMTDLAYATKSADFSKLFASVTDGYSSWIEAVSSFISSNPDTQVKSDLERRHLETARSHIDRCRRALKRIREGVSLLQSDPEVFDAFAYTCKAMLFQRVNSKFIQARKNKSIASAARPEYTAKGVNFWRPFQIGFILMNLKGIADPLSDDREIADLLWFPTGGGKTEAYLGLSAFAMFLRRIKAKTGERMGHGVSVIMRYTLRLLTVQQYQRAASLVCACEIIRRRDIEKLGSEPFLIGLWVGGKSTPNDFETARRKLIELSNGTGNPSEANPVQLTSCPWCGYEISARNFYADRTSERIIVHCHNKGCDFFGSASDISNALPVLSVDSDIYRRCPSIIIGTVDKFAVMSRKPEAATIFGYATRYCGIHGFLTSSYDDHKEMSHGKGQSRTEVKIISYLSPPDLIIQDELHLIGGPLGTIAGLYETAVEFLCTTTKGQIVYRPKILVSTATVKGVEYQVKKLFNRKRTETFPPPGLEAGDSYFWWEVEEGGRKFVGVSCPSYSVKTASLRIYASLLQKANELLAVHARNIDPYWTMVGYFNSKRELGGALRLIEDDVVRRINNIVELDESHSGQHERIIHRKRELTGRIPSSEIPLVLAEIEKNVQQDAIDILLATNMIAVGVDVDRLGLMVVIGQPKNTAEYIQAVGRVGRKLDAPGLIITLYNPYRPRDLSHYENFIAFHSMLQRFVDPVSITPFSDRAIQRALHAVFISIVRLLIPEYSSNTSARSFDPDNVHVKRAIQAIQERFMSVEGSDRSREDFIRFRKELEHIIEWWIQKRSKSPSLKYRSRLRDSENGDDEGELDDVENVLMIDVGEEGRFRTAKITPNSMRDVEKESNLYYDDR